MAVRKQQKEKATREKLNHPIKGYRYSLAPSYVKKYVYLHARYTDKLIGYFDPTNIHNKYFNLVGIESEHKDVYKNVACTLGLLKYLKYCPKQIATKQQMEDHFLELYGVK